MRTGHARTQGSKGAGGPGLSYGSDLLRVGGVGLMAMSMLTCRGPCFARGPAGLGKLLCRAEEGRGAIKGSRTQLSTHRWPFCRIRLGLLSRAQLQKEALWFLEIFASAGQVSVEQHMRRAQLCFPGLLEILGRCGPLQVQSGASHSSDA